MLNDELKEKLDILIKEKFELILRQNFDGRLFLYGDAIKNTLTGDIIKDLDFVVLTQEEDKIIEFIKKYNLKYKINMHGGYKITYNNFIIDIHSTNDLSSAGEYDLDMLFYDVKNRIFIPHPGGTGRG